MEKMGFELNFEGSGNEGIPGGGGDVRKGGKSTAEPFWRMPPI